jgi:transglutaminase-like putative cysteine protease
MNKRTSHHSVALILATVLIALLAYRSFFVRQAGEIALPEKSYFVDVVMEFDGHDGPVTVEMTRPRSDGRQQIFDEQRANPGFTYFGRRRGENSWAHWESPAVSGDHQIVYSFGVLGRRQAFFISYDIPLRQAVPDSVMGDLVAEEYIQSTNPLIGNLVVQLGLDTLRGLRPALKAIYDFTTDSLAYVEYSGTTDALTALKLQEASCGGKSRLFVALCRAVGIPARLVGGKILHRGQRRVMHVWTEAWVQGWWVPFCPTNHYFAEIPENYLKLYVGDEPFLTHTEDINFQYRIATKERLASREDLQRSGPTSQAALVDLWSSFRRAAISVELLRIILMLPLGALVVVIFRNLIGLQTFGTFMPALIAIAFRETGLLWGLAVFIAVILLGLVVRAALEKLQLLHTPRLSIMLTAVVVFLLVVASTGSTLHILDLARVSMFPMVILTLTIERAAIMARENGVIASLKVAASTAVVASSAYLLMEPESVQSPFVAYPEALLAVVIANIMIGRYAGLRLMEIWRFRLLATARKD